MPRKKMMKPKNCPKNEGRFIIPTFKETEVDSLKTTLKYKQRGNKGQKYFFLKELINPRNFNEE
jgi:hypothetical protein